MTDEELRQAIRRLTTDSKVTCEAMLSLAAETHTPPQKLGALCNEMKIKIISCQLGCFS